MSESKVDVKDEPIREVVVLQRDRFESPDDLARFASVIAGGRTAALYWAEGVVLLYFALPQSTETATKALIEDRRVYWTLVAYALMPAYLPVIETKEKIIAPVINLSKSLLFRKVANWLRKQEET